MPLIARAVIAWVAAALAAFALPSAARLVLIGALALAGLVCALRARGVLAALLAIGVGSACVAHVAAATPPPGRHAHHAPAVGMLAEARAATARRIDRLFGSDAPVVRALVIADMSQIPREARDDFARAGLVHMLSVSGLHVGIIALALELLASVLRIPRTPARLVVLGVLALYVAAIGAPPPAVRAAVMLGALLASRMLQRPSSPWAILALGAAAPLVEPRTVLDLGWQLSVAGTASLVSGAALSRRLVPDDWPRAARVTSGALVVSAVATVATAPLVAWSFGRVALLSPLTNLLADPIMALVQPLLFAALVLPGGAATWAVDASHALLAAFHGVATAAAAVPFAAPEVLPTVTTALAASVGAGAFLTACVARDPVRWSLLAVASLAGAVVAPAVPMPFGGAELHMIDVGQGDALALRSSAGRWVVVDAGRAWRGGDAGRRTVVPYLSRRGGEVALFVLSHPHADHVGGAASLLRSLGARRVLDPGFAGGTASYREALGVARQRRIPWQRTVPGDSLVVDDVVVHVLAPDSAWASGLADANLASVMLLVRAGGVRILLTGDAEAPEEQWLLEQGTSLGADVLKVGHHGSRTSTSPAFLAAVAPRLALVSVGAQNVYRHPDEDVMGALAARRIPVQRTDVHGSVVLELRDGRITVRTRAGRWTLAGADPDR